MNESPRLNANAPSEVHVPRNVAMLISCWLVVVFSVSCTAISTVNADKYEKVFNSFGADLPFLTWLFSRGSYFCWLLPIVAFALALFASTCKRYVKGFQSRITIGLIVLFLLSLGMLPLMIYSMYLPVLKLGTSH